MSSRSPKRRRFDGAVAEQGERRKTKSLFPKSIPKPAFFDVVEEGLQLTSAGVPKQLAAKPKADKGVGVDRQVPTQLLSIGPLDAAQRHLVKTFAGKCKSTEGGVDAGAVSRLLRLHPDNFGVDEVTALEQLRKELERQRKKAASLGRGSTDAGVAGGDPGSATPVDLNFAGRSVLPQAFAASAAQGSATPFAGGATTPCWDGGLEDSTPGAGVTPWGGAMTSAYAATPFLVQADLTKDRDKERPQKLSALLASWSAQGRGYDSMADTPVAMPLDLEVPERRERDQEQQQNQQPEELLHSIAQLRQEVKQKKSELREAQVRLVKRDNFLRDVQGRKLACEKETKKIIKDLNRDAEISLVEKEQGVGGTSEAFNREKVVEMLVSELRRLDAAFGFGKSSSSTGSASPVCLANEDDGANEEEAAAQSSFSVQELRKRVEAILSSTKNNSVGEVEDIVWIYAEQHLKLKQKLRPADGEAEKNSEASLASSTPGNSLGHKAALFLRAFLQSELIRALTPEQEKTSGESSESEQKNPTLERAIAELENLNTEIAAADREVGLLETATEAKQRELEKNLSELQAAEAEAARKITRVMAAAGGEMFRPEVAQEVEVASGLGNAGEQAGKKQSRQRRADLEMEQAWAAVLSLCRRSAAWQMAYGGNAKSESPLTLREQP
mmetsp:Transcript_16417/g.40569  ORF Transcript_16417/g.40569 Transcript_16417/m.40569 type:complete len:671 (+) Transcript_16417:80-2092(+)|eukprot:g433.t1